MRLNFLCPRQRDALAREPLAARQLWLFKLELLDTIAAEPSPHRVNLAGSGLEAATIYLRACPPRDAQVLGRYVDTALILVDLLATLGQSRLAIMVVAVGNALLEDLALTGRAPHRAAQACRELNRAGFARLRRGACAKGGPPAAAPPWQPHAHPAILSG